MTDPGREPQPASGPADPITSLAEGAAATHELYLAYVAAGFTKREALQIIIGIVTAAAAAASGGKS